MNAMLQGKKEKMLSGKRLQNREILTVLNSKVNEIGTKLVSNWEQNMFYAKS